MTGLRQTLGSAVAQSRWLGAATSGVERVAGYRGGYLPILAYHRVSSDVTSKTLYPGLISATPEALAAQAAVLAERFHLVSLDELLAARRGEHELPARSAMVTFDDAYADFESTAWPILQERGVPVTLFVATAYPDRDDLPFWWDRLHEILEHAEEKGVIESPLGPLPVHDAAARRAAYLRCRDHLRLLPTARSLELLEEMAKPLDVPAPRSAVLGWRALRRLAEEGVRIAAHTRTHPLLASTGLDEAAEELSGSIADVERELGRPTGFSPIRPGRTTTGSSSWRASSGSTWPSRSTSGAGTTWDAKTGCGYAGSSSVAGRPSR